MKSKKLLNHRIMNIEETKSYLRYRICDPVDAYGNERPMDEGRKLYLTGDEIVALLEYIESLEVKEVPFDEVRLHGTYRMRNGDVIAITMYDPNEFYCFGGYVDGEPYFFTKTGMWSRCAESGYDLVAEIQK